MKSIGVIVSDLYDSYQQALLRGVKYACELKGIRLLTFVGGPIGGYANFGIHRNSLYSIISESSVDGLVCISGSMSVNCGAEGLGEFLKELPNIPKVSIGVAIPEIPSIVINNKLGISLIMDHLITHHNFEKIAFIKGPEANQEAAERFEAYKESLERHNIKYNYKLVAPGAFSPGDGIKGINLIKDTRKEIFDAVVCCDDYTAIEVIGTLVNRGFSVPEDIAVTGFDDLERSGSFSPSLTTVSQPIFNLGSMSVEYLEDLCQNKVSEYKIVVDTSLQIRESCSCDKRREVGELKNSSLDDTFKELFHNVTANVIESRSIKFYKRDRVELVKPLIEKIANGVLESIESKSNDNLEDAISIVFNQSYNQNLKASFWKGVLEDLLIPFISGNSKNSLFIALLLKSALLKLYENERKLVEFKRIDDRTLIQYINRLGDQLLLCRTDTELQKVLRDNLTALRVNNFFVLRYLNSKEVAEVFFARNKENPNIVYEEKFSSTDILPLEAGNARNLSYILYPIVIDTHQIGYILIEHGDTPTIIYDFLAEKISYGFKNIRVMEQIGSYTEHLEKAVEERTKELKLANVQLQERSMKDQLTGLRNRRFLDEVVIPKADTLVKKIKNQVKYGNRAIGNENISFGLIMVDLDHFKEVNDIYGHASGDRVIKELGKLFTYSVRQEDYVIRLGGEEFLIVLTDFNASFISVIVEKIRKAVEDHSFQMENGEIIKKTCSLGAMAFPTNDPELINFRSSIAVIDKCLYHAKDNGRNSGYIIDVDVTQFSGCKNAGEYIINNFSKCLSEKKISLLNSTKR